jgi:YfiH family protein
MTLPTVPEPYYWKPLGIGPVLVCRALEDVAPHVFTTRELPLASDADWQRVGDALRAHQVARRRQVHGKDVAVFRTTDEVVARETPADILVTNVPGIAVAVRVADCVPLLLADRRLGVVAAVHAGWRGTAAGAAGAAVGALTREFGSRPEDLVAAIGPSIGPCCYEVGSDLVDAFAAAGHGRHLIDRWFHERPPASGASPKAAFGRRAPLRLDVPGANRDQLVLAGVPETEIHHSGLCTAMHLDLLTSFRMEKDCAGRTAGVIRPRHS